MSGRILVVLHQEHSTPGRVGLLLRRRGYDLDFRRPPLGCTLPHDLTDYAGVVVFGGPMSANDEHEWVRRQTDWIGTVLRAGVPFLGLCLGAQMLARQLGARVTCHPQGRVEVGYHPIRPTAEGLELERRLRVRWPRQVYHWHSEGFELPSGAVGLASGDVFPHQAFRYGPSAFGLQFHPEVTYAMMCRWTVRGHERLASEGAWPRHRQLADWFVHDPAVRVWSEAFIDHWLESRMLPAASMQAA